MRGIDTVKFKYSKPISPRMGSTDVTTGGYVGPTRIKTSQGWFYFDKNIGIYRFWFLFLKLGLELEQHNYSVRGLKGKGLVKVKVNKKFYKGWDLDEVLTTKWDQWLKSHRELFFGDKVKVVNEVSDNERYHYIQIDKNLNSRSVIPIIREIYKNLPKQTEKKNRDNYFVPKQRHVQIYLHVYYNLFMWLRTDKKLERNDIYDKLRKEYFGYYSSKKLPTLTEKGEKVMRSKQLFDPILRSDESEGTGRFEYQGDDTVKIKPPQGSQIRRMIRKSEQVLLDVCNGEF